VVEFHHEEHKVENTSYWRGGVYAIIAVRRLGNCFYDFLPLTLPEKICIVPYRLGKSVEAYQQQHP
jgi:hypothetical protein